GDGIRGFHVTGVQTCALPIYNKGQPLTNTPEHLANLKLDWQTNDRLNLWLKGEYRGKRARFTSTYENLAGPQGQYTTNQSIYDRSEERRVGINWRSWVDPHQK